MDKGLGFERECRTGSAVLGQAGACQGQVYGRGAAGGARQKGAILLKGARCVAAEGARAGRGTLARSAASCLGIRSCVCARPIL